MSYTNEPNRGQRKCLCFIQPVEATSQPLLVRVNVVHERLEIVAVGESTLLLSDPEALLRRRIIGLGAGQLVLRVRRFFRR